MRTYTIHEQPDAPADRIDRAERLVFVKDGFSWAAALFAPLWFLLHRLWWPLLGYVVVSAAFQIAQQAESLDARWLGLAALALNLLIGFEADTLRRWGLERRGWRLIGTVTGVSAADCERRFFDSWLPSQPILASGSTTPPPSDRGGWRIGGLFGAHS
ncbi:MAG: DUF2628 domain-containing protein [Hyphomicrobiaceae bacterium]|nr:DUF2628 domain-containing protein [Hyphomicrobiaceae bacterium]